MDLLKKIFRISNIGYVIFCGLNLWLILLLTTNGFRDYSSFYTIVLIYFLGIIISISPIGEAITVFLAGGRKITRLDMKLKIVPLLEIVYNKARIVSPNLPNSIKVKVIYDEAINAFSIGRKTICITSRIIKTSG